MAGSLWRGLGRALLRVLRESRSSSRQGSRSEPASTASSAPRAALLDSPGRSGADATVDVPRDELARIRISYAPRPDGDPDPGEVVWTWVPYAENDGRGKDRPVLIIGRIDERAVVGCYLSTKAHRGFVSVGSGEWDAQGRESFLSPERLLRITDRGMRREGHVLPSDRFERAVAVVRRVHRLAG